MWIKNWIELNWIECFILLFFGFGVSITFSISSCWWWNRHLAINRNLGARTLSPKILTDSGRGTIGNSRPLETAFIESPDHTSRNRLRASSPGRSGCKAGKGCVTIFLTFHWCWKLKVNYPEQDSCPAFIYWYVMLLFIFDHVSRWIFLTRPNSWRNVHVCS